MNHVVWKPYMLVFECTNDFYRPMTYQAIVLANAVLLAIAYAMRK